MPTNHQEQILTYLRKHKEASKKQLLEEFHHWYLFNAEKHLGDVLARMVKAKLIHKPSTGRYAIGYPIANNEPNLFNQDV